MSATARSHFRTGLIVGGIRRRRRIVCFAYYWRRAMAIGTGQQIGASVTSARLGALLEKLVAVQEELEPISAASRKGMPVAAASGAIADACDALLSAVADARNIIHQINGLTERPEPMYR